MYRFVRTRLYAMPYSYASPQRYPNHRHLMKCLIRTFLISLPDDACYEDDIKASPFLNSLKTNYLGSEIFKHPVKGLCGSKIFSAAINPLHE